MLFRKLHSLRFCAAGLAALAFASSGVTAYGGTFSLFSWLKGKTTTQETKKSEPDLSKAPSALSSVPVPTPPDLDNYIKDKDAAILLGKSLFWDMQVGSDGKTACASCHWHAGADARTKNVVGPGIDKFGPHQTFFERNQVVKADDFPFHKLKNPDEKRSSSNPVVRDTSEIMTSQGVIKKDFVAVEEGNIVDAGNLVPDPVFNIDGVNVRQNEPRHTPTTINAVFFDRLFWDGRANRFFNGVNPFGDMDPNARVLKNERQETKSWEWVKRYWLWFPYWSYELVTKTSGEPSLQKVKVLIDNGALASQAVGPPLSEVEMSWNRRMFPDLGRKMLSLRPLALQDVHHDDSVLASRRASSGRGLQATYPELIRNAFKDEWWNSEQITDEGYTHMEANFAFYWGLAIQMYEATLVSDQAPYDKWKNGDKSALSEEAKKGLGLFLNEGRCINCHGGSEFAGATVSSLRGKSPTNDPIEFMAMQQGKAFYDGGFYNIGVRPTEEDLGVGGRHPQFGPLSYTRRVQEGQKPYKLDQDVSVSRWSRVAVDGAFKTPTLRNIELTGPYMHNGGMRTLKEVVQFYARRADFFEENIENLDPDVHGIDEVRGDDEKINQLIAFMKSLTDERVRFDKAPFDHPQLVIPNGHSGIQDGVALDDDFILPAVGRNGGAEVRAFEKIVN